MKNVSLKSLSFVGLALMGASALVAVLTPSKAANKPVIPNGSVTRPNDQISDCTWTNGKDFTEPCFTTANISGSQTAGTTI